MVVKEKKKELETENPHRGVRRLRPRLRPRLLPGFLAFFAILLPFLVPPILRPFFQSPESIVFYESGGTSGSWGLGKNEVPRAK